MSNALQLALIVPALLGVVVSFLTELVTKAHAPSSLKALANTVLSAVAGALSTVVFDPHSPWTVYAWAIIAAVLTSQATHRTGITTPLQNATADTGLGVTPTPVTGDAGGAVDTDFQP